MWAGHSCSCFHSLSFSHKSFCKGQQLDDAARTSVLCLKPNTNSTVSKSHISQAASESCSGSVTLVDLTADLNGLTGPFQHSQLFCCVNSLKSGDFGPSIIPDLLEPSKGFSDLLYLVGPVWPSRSKTHRVWSLTAILSTAEGSSAQEGNKMGEKLVSTKTVTHKYNLHHQIWKPAMQLYLGDYIIFKTWQM